MEEYMKVIAFDLVGVLVREKNIELSPQQTMVEKYFGKNMSNEMIDSIIDSIVGAGNRDKVVVDIINNLYETKNLDCLDKVKEHYPNILVVIASNHIQNIRKYIDKNIGLNRIDDMIISSEIGHNKPNADFYNYILDKYRVLAEDVLFIDDRQVNIVGAEAVGLRTILVNKDTNLWEEISKILSK